MPQFPLHFVIHPKIVSHSQHKAHLYKSSTPDQLLTISRRTDLFSPFGSCNSQYISIRLAWNFLSVCFKRHCGNYSLLTNPMRLFWSVYNTSLIKQSKGRCNNSGDFTTQIVVLDPGDSCLSHKIYWEPLNIHSHLNLYHRDVVRIKMGTSHEHHSKLPGGRYKNMQKK